jgi:hypothetical protein
MHLVWEPAPDPRVVRRANFRGGRCIVFNNEEILFLEFPSLNRKYGVKNRFVIAFLLVITGFFVVSRPLLAHHSSAAYEMEHPVNMKGVVTNMEWTNPHVFIFLDVKDDNGSVEEWRVEGNSPNMLVRTGWKREMIKAGDPILVNGAPAKNGSKVMRLITLTLANGQKYDGQGFK